VRGDASMTLDDTDDEEVEKWSDRSDGVNQYHLLHDTEDEIQKGSHRIKQMLKKQFLKVRVIIRSIL